MKRASKHITRAKDDTLYGLLSSYKANHTYMRVLESTADEAIVVQLTDNPGNFNRSQREKLKTYRMLRRLEIGIAKMSLKYLTPECLVSMLGPMLEINVPYEKAVIDDGLQKDGIYTIETSLRYKTKILQGVKKLLGMSPQKRYELLEKYVSGNQE